MIARLAVGTLAIGAAVLVTGLVLDKVKRTYHRVMEVDQAPPPDPYEIPIFDDSI